MTKRQISTKANNVPNTVYTVPAIILGNVEKLFQGSIVSL